MTQAASLHVVGLGPGDAQCLTPQARAVLAQASCVVGYHLYMDMVPPELLEGKELISTGMRHETERCAAAVDAALAGRPTALVCSGDPGIYDPRSRGRPGHLDHALELARRFRAGECPVGLVRQAYRPGQSVSVHRLDAFDAAQVDMLSLLIIGNNESRSVGSYMLTPRGYARKRRL